MTLCTALPLLPVPPNQDSCLICLTSLNTDPNTPPPLGHKADPSDRIIHVYHQHCWRGWEKSEAIGEDRVSCPTCRKVCQLTNTVDIQSKAQIIFYTAIRSAMFTIIDCTIYMAIKTTASKLTIKLKSTTHAPRLATNILAKITIALILNYSETHQLVNSLMLKVCHFFSLPPRFGNKQINWYRQASKAIDVCLDVIWWLSLNEASRSKAMWQFSFIYGPLVIGCLSGINAWQTE